MLRLKNINPKDKYAFSEEYLLKIRFSDSITRLFNKIWDSKELTNFIEEQWNQPIVKLPYLSNNHMKTIAKLHLEFYHIPYLEKEDWIYISCKNLVIFLIWLHIKTYDSTNSTLYTVNKLLNWGVCDYYFVSWEKWRRLIKEISNKTEENRTLRWIFTDAKEKYLKIYDLNNIKLRDFNIFSSRWGLIDVSKMTENDMKKLRNSYSWYWDFLYFDEKASKIYANNITDKELREWFNEIVIFRNAISNQNLLISTLYSLYSKNDVYLYYNPLLLDMNITETKFINLRSTENYNLLNFSAIIRQISHFEETKKYLENIIWNNIIKINNDEDIKKVFDSLFQNIIKIWVDNVVVVVKWIVNDKDRYNEINSAVKRWNITIHKDNREKWHIEVSFQDSLHDFLKRERKNLKSG